MRILHRPDCREGTEESTEKPSANCIFIVPGYLDDLQSGGLSGDQADVPGVEVEAPGEEIEQRSVCLAVHGGRLQSNLYGITEHAVDGVNPGSGYGFDGQAAGLHLWKVFW